MYCMVCSWFSGIGLDRFLLSNSNWIQAQWMELEKTTEQQMRHIQNMLMLAMYCIGGSLNANCWHRWCFARYAGSIRLVDLGSFAFAVLLIDITKRQHINIVQAIRCKLIHITFEVIKIGSDCECSAFIQHCTLLVTICLFALMPVRVCSSLTHAIKLSASKHKQSCGMCALHLFVPVVLVCLWVCYWKWTPGYRMFAIKIWI